MKSQKSVITHQDELQTSRKIHIKKSNQIQPVNFKNAHFGRRRVKTKTIDLESIVLKQKINQIVNNFISKLRTNSVYRSPCQNDYSYDSTKPKNKKQMPNWFDHCIQRWSQKEGIEVGNFGLIVWSLISIIQITIVVFMFSIMITFPETQNFQSFLYFRMFSIAIYFVDMILSFTIKRYGDGKNLQKLGQISSHYVHNEFAIDLISMLIFPIDILFNVQTGIQIFLFFLSILKQINNLRKFEKFQYLFIDTSLKQQYYGLIKVLLVNFAIAHFLSIILNFMAQIDTDQNWYSKVQIQNEEWYVKYIWGYYWGTNIMLTVGFGDISATNTYEAFALIFIQAFSCITLAYNVSYVGALIGSLRENDKLKKRKLKVFHRMCKQNFISNEIQAKVANFIQVEHQIKQQFQYEAHDEVLKQLPSSIQRQFRQEANKSLFENLGFLNIFFKKALVKLADKIERRVYHPEQIVLQRGSVPNFSVLQTGTLALVCRIKSTIDGKEIQKIEVCKGQKPKIISYDFIKNKAIKYSLKSINFSVLFYLSEEQLMQCVRSSDISLQTYFMLKDKQNSLYESQNLICSICKNQHHTKFQCSRLHYVPLSRNIIFKYIHRQNSAKQERLPRWKRHKVLKSSLQNFNKINNDHRRFIQINFGDEHFREAEELFKFYSTNIASADYFPEEDFNGLKSSINQVQILRSTTRGCFKNWGRRTFSKLEKFLQNKQNRNLDFWDLEIDAANNFKFYFKEGNSDNVNNLLSKSKKQKYKIGSTFGM